MNEFSHSESVNPVAKNVRLNSGTNLLIALGVGLVVAALVQALRPAPKPQQRLAQLLEDMEENLREVSAPALNRVGAFATDGAEALTGTLHRGEVQVEKFLRNAARRLRRLAS